MLRSPNTRTHYTALPRPEEGVSRVDSYMTDAADSAIRHWRAVAHCAGRSLLAAYGLDAACAAGAMVAAAAGRPVLAPIRLRALANMALMSPPPLQSAQAETLLSAPRPGTLKSTETSAAEH